MHTIKIEDLDFSNEYKILITRDDFVNAYLGWFEVYFSHCHKPVKLSTSPYMKETHWK